MTDFMIVVLSAILISALLGFGGSATANAGVVTIAFVALNRLIRGGTVQPATG